MCDSYNGQDVLCYFFDWQDFLASWSEKEYKKGTPFPEDKIALYGKQILEVSCVSSLYSGPSFEWSPMRDLDISLPLITVYHYSGIAHSVIVSWP